MSSTLFARGVNSQVGMKRRADDMNKNIAGIKNDIVLIKQTSDEIVSLKAVIVTLTEKVAALQKTVDSLIASASASASASGGPSMTIQNAS
jgi:hypothetical protein